MPPSVAAKRSGGWCTTSMSRLQGGGKEGKEGTWIKQRRGASNWFYFYRDERFHYTLVLKVHYIYMLTVYWNIYKYNTL